MADKTIDQLTAAAPLAGTEELPLWQASATLKTTAQAIADLHMDAVDSVNGFTGAVSLDAPDVNAPKLVATPTLATDPGLAGQIAFDAGFAYFCIATNTWLRVAIATW